MKTLTLLLAAILSFLLLLSKPALAQDLVGSAEAGSKKNALCIGCHGIIGYKASFPEVYRVPKLYGQNPKYIIAALGEYKRGERKHPSMHGIAQSLSDQDMADLALYFSTAGIEAAKSMSVKAVSGQAEALPLIAKGGCQACHGDHFNNPMDASFPILAGQNGDYLYQALKAYKTNSKPFYGRTHPIMSAMAAQFSDAELYKIAYYLETLPSELITLQRSRFH